MLSPDCSQDITPQEVAADKEMTHVVASLKYIRANYTAMRQPEQYLYESLSFLTESHAFSLGFLSSTPNTEDIEKLS